jgi:hypothetical protein
MHRRGLKPVVKFLRKNSNFLRSFRWSRCTEQFIEALPGVLNTLGDAKQLCYLEFPLVNLVGDDFKETSYRVLENEALQTLVISYWDLHATPIPEGMRCNFQNLEIRPRESLSIPGLVNLLQRCPSLRKLELPTLDITGGNPTTALEEPVLNHLSEISLEFCSNNAGGDQLLSYLPLSRVQRLFMRNHPEGLDLGDIMSLEDLRVTAEFPIIENLCSTYLAAHPTNGLNNLILHIEMIRLYGSVSKMGKLCFPCLENLELLSYNASGVESILSALDAPQLEVLRLTVSDWKWMQDPPIISKTASVPNVKELRLDVCSTFGID